MAIMTLCGEAELAPPNNHGGQQFHDCPRAFFSTHEDVEPPLAFPSLVLFQWMRTRLQPVSRARSSTAAKERPRYRNLETTTRAAAAVERATLRNIVRRMKPPKFSARDGAITRKYNIRDVFSAVGNRFIEQGL